MEAKVTREFVIRDTEIEKDDRDVVQKFISRYGMNFKIDWAKDVKIVIEKKMKGEEERFRIVVKDVDVEQIDTGQMTLFEKLETEAKEEAAEESNGKSETSNDGESTESPAPEAMRVLYGGEKDPGAI